MGSFFNFFGFDFIVTTNQVKTDIPKFSRLLVIANPPGELDSVTIDKHHSGLFAYFVGHGAVDDGLTALFGCLKQNSSHDSQHLTSEARPVTQELSIASTYKKKKKNNLKNSLLIDFNGISTCLQGAEAKLRIF